MVPLGRERRVAAQSGGLRMAFNTSRLTLNGSPKTVILVASVSGLVVSLELSRKFRGQSLYVNYLSSDFVAGISLHVLVYKVQLMHVLFSS